jgi:hypothetical protein
MFVHEALASSGMYGKSCRYCSGGTAQITLADLLHLPYGAIIFEDFGFGNLEKCPNVQRQ